MRSMTTWRQILATACLTPLLALACGGGDGGSAGGDAAPERRFLSLGSAPPGGAFYVVGSALADVMTIAHQSWQVTNESTKGSQENIRRLVRGELDLALSNAAITYFAVRGEGDWQAPQEVRSLMTLAPNVALFIAPRQSGVQTIADLRGRRVVIGPAGAGFEDFVGPILGAHGLTWSDLTPLNATQSAAVDQLADGSAAAAFIGGAIPTSSITQAATSQDIVFVPFDDAAKTRLIAEYPFFAPATIPAGTYRGLEQDYAGLNVGDMHLIVASGAPEDLVYEMTKAIWEHRADVVERHPAGRSIREQNAARETGTPFHPGAIRFYREIGIWSEEGEPDEGESEATEAGSTGETAAAGQ
jgi:hypothetical protein